MNTKMHRKGIKQIWWPDSSLEQGRHISSNDGTYLEMSATYHGDHDEFWIIEYGIQNGKFQEVARHNPRYVESIIWI